MGRLLLLVCLILCTANTFSKKTSQLQKTRVIVITDGEIDDECSLVRFLLYANEWDIEGIITSSSQYHWHGHKWAGDNWMDTVMNAYAKVYPNLKKHSANYPSPEYLKSVSFLGNVEAEGEMEQVTLGSEHIVKVLLDETDNRPIWIQAWGGTNTLARALKTIEEQHADKMDYVASKLRFFFIWEQDDTYQKYIRPHWGKYNILTIISDQFIALFYHWKKYLPDVQQTYLKGAWMKESILENHGALCSAYKAHVNGDFRSEGDSPAFMYTIPTGLENLEHPDWGGWGGRYVRVRENTWLDPVAESGYKYPLGRWYTLSGWGRLRLQKGIPQDNQLTDYLKPIWRWTEAFQNDFAARADWCVKSYKEANHPPVVILNQKQEIEVERGGKIKINAKESFDPDGDKLSIYLWQYKEAGTFMGDVVIKKNKDEIISVIVPNSAKKGEIIHLVCEVKDNGIPQLTRYKRLVIVVKS